MGKSLFLGMNFAYILCYSLLANLMGNPNSVLDFPTQISDPEPSSLFAQIMAPLLWVFDALGSITGMIGYGFVGVDPVVFLIAIAPLFIIDTVLVVGLVRGGGS